LPTNIGLQETNPHHHDNINKARHREIQPPTSEVEVPPLTAVMTTNISTGANTELDPDNFRPQRGTKRKTDPRKQLISSQLDQSRYQLRETTRNIQNEESTIASISNAVLTPITTMGNITGSEIDASSNENRRDTTNVPHGNRSQDHSNDNIIPHHEKAHEINKTTNRKHRKPMYRIIKPGQVLRTYTNKINKTMTQTEISHQLRTKKMTEKIITRIKENPETNKETTREDDSTYIDILNKTSSTNQNQSITDQNKKQRDVRRQEKDPSGTSAIENSNQSQHITYTQDRQTHKQTPEKGTDKKITDFYKKRKNTRTKHKDNNQPSYNRDRREETIWNK